MIIIYLKGGLGNQMFQYATARSLAERASSYKYLPIKIYLNNLKKSNTLDTLRNLGVDSFDSKIEIIQGNITKKRFFLSLAQKVFRKYYICYDQKFISKSIIKLKNNEDIYIDGFYQSEKYFSDIRDILLKEFTLKEESSLYKNAESLINSAPIPVSLHVRRGDYIAKSKTNKYHGTYENDYYKKACEILAQKLGNQSKNITIFAFSDDPEWVKIEIKLPFPVTIVSNGILKPHEELMLMSKCKHNIIANSSFSWWGAWLNQNPDKIVIAPKIWFKGTSPKVYKDIVPESWIKI